MFQGLLSKTGSRMLEGILEDNLEDEDEPKNHDNNLKSEDDPKRKITSNTKTTSNIKMITKWKAVPPLLVSSHYPWKINTLCSTLHFATFFFFSSLNNLRKNSKLPQCYQNYGSSNWHICLFISSWELFLFSGQVCGDHQYIIISPTWSGEDALFTFLLWWINLQTLQLYWSTIRPQGRG